MGSESGGKRKRNGRENRENINIGPDCKTVRSMSNWKIFDVNFWPNRYFDLHISNAEEPLNIQQHFTLSLKVTKCLPPLIQCECLF